MHRPTGGYGGGSGSGSGSGSKSRKHSKKSHKHSHKHSHRHSGSGHCRPTSAAARTPGPPPRHPPADSLIEAAPEVGVRAIFRRFWPLTRPYRGWLVLTGVFTVATPLMDATGIWLFKLLVDDVLTPRDFGAFGRVALLYVVIAVVSGAIASHRYVSSWIGERFVTDLLPSLYEHLHGLSMDFFERRRLGDLLTRLSGDVMAIQSLVLFGITTLLSYVLRIVVYAGALFYLDGSPPPSP